MEGKEVETTTTKNVEKETVDLSGRTLVELLKENPNLQSEFDKLNAKSNETAIENAKSAWEKEAEEKKTEAERLAKLTDDERHRVELEKEVNARKEIEAKLNAFQLKDQAEKDNPDVPKELISLIDFNICNTADKVQKQVDTIKTTFTKAVENALNDAFKEKTPKTVVNSSQRTRISRASY